MSGAPVRIEVAVCTCGRSALSEALASLDRQEVPAWLGLSVLVIDNDETPSAEGAVRAFAETSDVPVRYVHCPAFNISVARNGALDHARARLLAFMDDDETAEPGWIAALASAQAESGADVVLGPVRAVYGPGAPGWMRRLDMHSTRPVEVQGTIRTGYSCNVLMDLESPAFRGLRFDPALGRSGGEDTSFFTRAYRRGARLVAAEQAVVTEKVGPERARFAWLARRRFRSGQTHGRLLAETATGLPRVAALGLAGLKLAYCAGGAILAAPDTARRNAALLRGCLHAGTATGLIGIRPITLYGAATSGAGQ